MYAKYMYMLLYACTFVWASGHFYWLLGTYCYLWIKLTSVAPDDIRASLIPITSDQGLPQQHQNQAKLITSEAYRLWTSKF